MTGSTQHIFVHCTGLAIESHNRILGSALVPEGNDVQALPRDAVVDEVSNAGQVQAAYFNLSVVFYLRADPRVLSQDPERALEVQPYRARCGRSV